MCIRDRISSNVEDPTFFVLPDITAQLSALENETELTDEQRLEKKERQDPGAGLERRGRRWRALVSGDGLPLQWGQ